MGFQLFAQMRPEVVDSEIVKTRLGLYKGSDQVREAALFKTFVDAGCPAANLSEQPVPKRKEPNLICVLPGDTAEEIIIGAHFDHVSEGSGVVDNWSGASLLPSLFQSLLGSKHKHTFRFIGFTGEESREVGSGFYVQSLSNVQLNEIKLMITLDSIGLGPTKVWVSRSDKHAVALLNGTAHAMKLPLGGVNVDGFGESDEEPFIKRGIKTITIHSVTEENKRVLHSEFDTLTAISFHDYYDTYRLLAGYLTILDRQESTGPSGAPQEH
ncbi:MAG TPA: M28 family peptidase [Terracidiphilus sp.]|nr:M28 family peptidase [Terracidiphilus sp.]